MSGPVTLTATIAEGLEGLRFFGALPLRLRRPIPRESARAAVRERLARRGEGLLTLARTAIFPFPASPYARLLAHAGLAYGDLEGLVARQGLDEALAHLFRSGVYLTGDELKGRHPVVRGNLRFTIDTGALRNPTVVPHLLATSSGSRGRGTMVALDLRSVRDQATNTCLELHARGALGWRHAAWRVPGGAQLTQTIRYAMAGTRFERTFTPVDPGMASLHPRYRWSERILRWAMRAGGHPMPPLEHVALDRPLPILQWMARVLREGGVPHVLCYSSGGARLCRAAVDAGIGIAGARLTVGGEPVTSARLAAIAAAGVVAGWRYGCTEAGGILAVGCLAPRSAGELHFMHDLRAVIQPGADGATAGLPPRALLVTSLRPITPLVLLNASLGDEGTLGSRDCGCPMEAEGWTTHLEELRSFEKLTIGGMCLAHADLGRLVDEVLPARFGGGPADWQLVEEEATDGAPHLYLAASPRLGPLAGDAVSDAVLSWIGRGDGVERIASILYRDGGFVRMVRREPFTTSGKVGHVHVARADSTASAGSRHA
jgi:hypothetical protein